MYVCNFYIFHFEVRIALNCKQIHTYDSRSIAPTANPSSLGPTESPSADPSTWVPTVNPSSSTMPSAQPMTKPSATPSAKPVRSTKPTATPSAKSSSNCMYTYMYLLLYVPECMEGILLLAYISFSYTLSKI